MARGLQAAATLQPAITSAMSWTIAHAVATTSAVSACCLKGGHHQYARAVGQRPGINRKCLVSDEIWTSESCLTGAASYLSLVTYSAPSDARPFRSWSTPGNRSRRGVGASAVLLERGCPSCQLAVARKRKTTIQELCLREFLHRVDQFRTAEAGVAELSMSCRLHRVVLPLAC